MFSTLYKQQTKHADFNIEEGIKCILIDAYKKREEDREWQADRIVFAKNFWCKVVWICNLYLYLDCLDMCIPISDSVYSYPAAIDREKAVMQWSLQR